MNCKLKSRRGQGTVEAVVVIPVLFVLMLLLLQPGIILYDRIVMGNAAAEGCRLLATSTDVSGSMEGSCEAFVRHRLASVPQQDCFHVHGGECGWGIELAGGEGSDIVSVRITNEVKPLPLFDVGARLLGVANSSGYIVLEESVSMPAQPGWVSASPQGTNPSGWPGAWLE